MLLNETQPTAMYGQTDEDDFLNLCEEIGLKEEHDLIPGFDPQFSFNSKMQLHNSSKRTLASSIDFGLDIDPRMRSKSQGTINMSNIPDSHHSWDYLNLCLPDIMTDNFDTRGNDDIDIIKTYSGYEEKHPSSGFSSPSQSRGSASPHNYIKKEFTGDSNVQPIPSYDEYALFKDKNDNSIVFKNRFLSQYWRNDRKNLQCFPFCPEHEDYYLVKTKGLRHTKAGGTCGESVKAILRNTYDDKKDLIALGRITRDDLTDFDHKDVISGKEFTAERKESIVGALCSRQVSDEDTSRGIINEIEITFSSTVWKLDAQLSKTRRAVNGPPKEANYFFEVLVFRKDHDAYRLIARKISSRFLIASTRTLHRATQAKEGRSDVSSMAGTHSPTSLSQPGSPHVVPASPSDYVDMDMSEHQSNVRKYDEVYEDETFDRNIVKAARHQKALDASTVAMPSSPNKQPDVEDLEANAAELKNPTPDRDEYISVVNDNERYKLSEAWKWSGLGFVGAHYYYLNQPKKGLLYTFTLGLLFFGWIYDMLTMPYIVSRFKISNAATRLNLPVCYELYTKEAYIYSVPFGLFGAHRFYLGEYKTGFLYMCTLGLLGFGFVRDLINMQSIVENANKQRQEEFVKQHGQSKLRSVLGFNKKYNPESSNV